MTYQSSTPRASTRPERTYATAPGTRRIRRGAVWLTVIAVGIAAVRYAALPDQIPVHFNLAGEPDGWGSRSSILVLAGTGLVLVVGTDRKSTRLNSSHVAISYAVFCLNKK